MSLYKYDCSKCTNKAISCDGSVYCLPMITGKKANYIESGSSGKDFVFNCDGYTKESKQLVIYESVVG